MRTDTVILDDPWNDGLVLGVPMSPTEALAVREQINHCWRELANAILNQARADARRGLACCPECQFMGHVCRADAEAFLCGRWARHLADGVGLCEDADLLGEGRHADG